MTPEDCAPRHAPLVPPVDGCDGHTHAGHAHSHVHPVAEEHRPRQRRALVLCIALTTVTMVGEVIGGWWTGSLMLLSDAVHMLSHALALVVSYVALRLATRPSGGRSHYGLYRTEILGAFVNGLGVLAFTAFIVWEAIERFREPVAVLGGEMTVIALIGLAVNLTTAVILARAGAEDLNTKSAYLHMLGDTLSSVAIVAGGVVLWFTGWSWLDPALSLLVAAVILVWGVGLLRDSSAVLLEMSPHGVDVEAVRGELVGAIPDVIDVHDVHVWEITTGYVCMTAHVVVEDKAVSETGPIHAAVAQLAKERFGIGHVTLQLESVAAAA